MTPLIWRILAAVVSLGVAGLALGAGEIIRWARNVSTSYGAGFLLIVGLMTLLALISIVRMPLSHAPARRRHR